MSWNSNDTLLTVGVVIELLGVGLTAAGLLQTWREHATGQERFGPALLSDLRRLRDAILRRPGPPQTIYVTAWDDAGASDHAHVTMGFSPTATLEQKLDQLKAEVDRAALTAGQAKSEAERTATALSKAEGRLTQQIADLRTHTEVQLRVFSLEGLPLAVLGLVVTVVGTAVQWVASALM